MPRRVLLLSVLLFLAAAAIGGLVVWQAERAWRADQREAAGQVAAGAAFALEQQVARSLSATYMLAALVQHDEAVADFDVMAARILPAFGAASNLQLAPGGVVRRIYPLAGNEAAIGHDLLADPARRREAADAMSSRQLTVAGPFELRQGGLGLVGRLAVHLPAPGAPGGERFWGLVITLVRLPPLLEAAQLSRLDEAGYAWRLTRQDPGRGPRACFAGCDPAPAEPTVDLQVDVPNGDWTLSVAPRGGWPRPGWLLPAWLAALLCALAFAAMGHQVLLLPERLQREVGLRTEELARANAALAGEIAVRQRTEQALRSSEETFRAIFRTNPEPVSLSHLGTGVVVAVNEGFLRFHGLREEEVLGRSPVDLGLWVDPAERAAVVAEVRAHGVLRGRDVRLKAADGMARVLSFSATVVTLGGAPHLLAVGRDVTEERSASEALQRVTAELRRSEERRRFAMRSMPIVHWAIDREGRFTLSEGQGLAALGLRPGEVVGRSVAEVYRDYPEVQAAFQRALAGETLEIRATFGSVVFESHWAPLRDDAGELVGVTGVALDVTGRAQEEAARHGAEARLALLERLAATGRLAAGVAHEINNPLTYVLGNLEVLLAQLEGAGGDPATLTILRDARDGAVRVRDIVRDLRVFARGGDDAVGTSAPVAAVRAALDIAGNEIRHRARLVTHLAPTPRAAIPERRLTQVLVNLLVNACRAIPEEGDGEKEVRVSARSEGGRAVLEVADTGVGMTPEVQARLFEPFFTTRDVGEGMGLGLALSRAMVVEAGGEIEVESTPGRGSLFRLRLPAAPPEAARPAQPAAAGPEPASPDRPLRVLVVDDEPMVGRAVARALRHHDVTVAGSVAEALDQLGSGPPPDVIVCDLMMPEVTGMDLHDRLAAERPALAGRMIFLTGGAFTDRARTFVEGRRDRVAEKPVDAASLLRLVEAVGRPAGPAGR